MIQNPALTPLQESIPPKMLRRSFDNVCERFARFGVDLRLRINQLIEAEGARRLVLDLCCGSGVAANDLAYELNTKDDLPAEDDSSVRVVGVDLNPLYPEDRKKHPKLHLKSGDATIIAPLEDESVDAAYLMAGLAYIPNGVAVLEAVYSKLRVGGEALLYFSREDYDLAATLTLRQILYGANVGDFTINHFVPGVDTGFYPDSALLQMRRTDSRPLDFGLKFEGHSQSMPEGTRIFEPNFVHGHYSKK